MLGKAQVHAKALTSGGSAAIALFALTAFAIASPLLLRGLGISATTGSVTVFVNQVVNGADIVLTLVAVFGIWTGAATIAAVGVRAILKLATTNAARKVAIPQIVK